MEISETIRRLRVIHGMTQAELGKIANSSDRSVSAWERGAKIPRMGVIQRLADYFNIKKSDIIDGTVQFDNLSQPRVEPKQENKDILDVIFDDQPDVLRAIRSIKADDGLVIDESNKKFIQKAILMALKEAKEKGIDHVKIDL